MGSGLWSTAVNGRAASSCSILHCCNELPDHNWSTKLIRDRWRRQVLPSGTVSRLHLQNFSRAQHWLGYLSTYKKLGIQSVQHPSCSILFTRGGWGVSLFWSSWRPLFFLYGGRHNSNKIASYQLSYSAIRMAWKDRIEARFASETGRRHGSCDIFHFFLYRRR